MKLLLVVFILCAVALCQANRAATLRFNKHLDILASSLKTFMAPSRGIATGHYDEGSDAPLIVGINKAVDAIGQIIRSLLQILGLIPQESQPMHYCYGPQYRYY